MSTPLLRSTTLLAGLLFAGSAITSPCAEPGKWYDPGHQRTLGTHEVLDALEGVDFILLGERHDDAAHHRWQLHTLAALHGRGELGAIGFEMFPRSKQKPLEDWRTGNLTREAFLEETEWQRVWGYDAELYMPLFEFVRAHRVPAEALNVERDTVRAVRERGFDDLDEDERESVGQPAAASEAYRDRLQGIFRHHPGAGENDADLDRFIEAQTFWDRAMAESMVSALEAYGGPVVGIVGRGHAEYGDGIAHQLRDLGHDSIRILLPLDAAAACPDADRADFVFALEPERATPDPPRLGIAMEEDDSKVTILEVFPDTPADQAGLAAGDRIVKAAETEIRRPRDLQHIVSRQAPGTWLPLVIERNGETLEKVARFPAE
ncbi:MAG: ChaN family lipoprotein [Halorhodospira halophila]|uniref:ChaN family lipoprotein n=1 Tax=Halorhodospira halophila TaxID=1053 RepID=UPI0026EF640C|nr:ChaN family lipoprotein [Halorhodospira halophila]MCC3750651.1 ChaN family lipoprotein [Halorhodospira halophila]